MTYLITDTIPRPFKSEGNRAFISKDSTMEKRTHFNLAFIGSSAALLSILYIVFGIPVPESIYSLQPSDMAMPEADFLKPVIEAPELMIRFFTADSFLILGGIFVYMGMFAVVTERSRLIAGTGLGIGLITILLDLTENAFLISYAQQSVNGAAVTAPALPLLYVIANLKMTGSFAGFLVFGLSWPRRGIIEWMLSSLMILYAVIGVLSLASPGFTLFRGILFLLCFVFFVYYFFTLSRRQMGGN